MHACNSFQVLFAAAIAAALPCSAAVRLLAPAEGETVPLLSDGQTARLSAPRGQPAKPGFDHSKYDAIGESDRMTLRFVKPK